MKETTRGKIGYVCGIITVVSAVIMLAVNIFTGKVMEDLYYTVLYVACIFGGIYLTKICKKMKDGEKQ